MCSAGTTVRISRSDATPEEKQAARAARQAAEKERFDQLVEMQKFVPPLWVPYGALALAEHRVLPALLGMFGCAGLGVLGLRRAYRSTVRFYHGETGGKAGRSGAQSDFRKVHRARQSAEELARIPFAGYSPSRPPPWLWAACVRCCARRR